MYSRLLDLDLNESHLLLGARGTGKSTFLRRLFDDPNQILWIDLLKPEVEDRYRLDPQLLERQCAGLDSIVKYVVVDEIQKVPSLLDVVHLLIESTDLRFILTGSSARKLKRGSANLLAGRALANFLFPLSFIELSEDFELSTALSYGTLPKIWTTKSDKTRRKFLETYALTYIKEEVQAEQLTRLLDPFRRFLAVAAQMNGKIINFQKIASDVGVDPKTVRNYFEILEDTLIGFLLEAYDKSTRKRLRKSSKFYFFDPGVARSLANELTIPLVQGTYAWGASFEHFIICEMQRLISYSGNQFELAYCRTENGVEIDVVCLRPGLPPLLIEIKSTHKIKPEAAKSLLSLGPTIDAKAEKVILSNDPLPQLIDGVQCYPWKTGLRKLFVGPDIEQFPVYSD